MISGQHDLDLLICYLFQGLVQWGMLKPGSSNAPVAHLIAGHRDGYFRVLKDVKAGQHIEIETRLRRHVYRVTSMEVVDPDALHVLADSELPTLTLVTCYPFYFMGHAPQRFIVRGAYEWT